MDFGELFSQHKTAAIVIGGIALGAIAYSFLHKGSSTTSATSYNPSSGSAASPTQYLVPYNAYFGGGGTPDNSNPGQGSGTPSSNIPSNNPNQSNPPTQTATSGPMKAPGFGTENIGGTKYSILGIESGRGASAYSGYDVGGGAPVYYLAPGSSTPTQGTSQAVQGAQVLVPSIYDPNISSTPTRTYSG